MSPDAKLVYEQGYVVLESVYSADECAEMERILLNAWERDNKRPMGGRFGCVFHPLLKYAPDMAPFYAKPEVVDVMADVLRDDVLLAHSGALLANEERGWCDWHAHLNGNQFNQWYDKPADYGERVERVLANVYLHGSTERTGQLLVHPRKVTDSWQFPHEDRLSEWDGQTVVNCPAGSVVIFDIALFHAARRPTQPGLRFLWGGHYTGKANAVPHREDNWHNGEELTPYREQFPLFASLTELPPAKFRV